MSKVVYASAVDKSKIFTKSDSIGSLFKPGEAKLCLQELKPYLISDDWKNFFVNLDGVTQTYYQMSGLAEYAFQYLNANLNTSEIIAPGLFYGRDLIEIDLSGTKINRIAPYAFYKSEIREINLPGSIREINFGAFQYCSSLTEVYIPNSVLHIDDGAFVGCNNIRSVTIPKEYEKSIRLLFSYPDTIEFNFI